MSTTDLSRLVAVGPTVGAATAFRISFGCADLWLRETPRLANLWLGALEPAPEADQAGSTFLEELIGTARASTKIAFEELERGIDDVEGFTRAREANPPVPAASS